jgi:hypothetical protein
MPQGIRRHLSFANVTSLTALVLAMSGGAYALSIPKNSVGPSQIKKNAVTSSKIKKNSVSASKVKDGSLLSADFKAGQLPAGAKGATGTPGTPGAPGAPGAPLGGTIVRRTDIALPAGAGAGVPGAITSAFATCDPGEKIVGGSANVSNVPNPPVAELLGDRPSVDTTGNSGAGTVPAPGDGYAYWKGTARTLTNNNTISLRVFAICAVP